MAWSIACTSSALLINVPSQEPVIFRAQFDFESVHKLLLVGQIHKPIAGGGGSHVGALQPGKMDNQCVEMIPLVIFRWIERRPPTLGGYPGAYLRSLG